MRNTSGFKSLFRFARNEYGGALAELAILVPFLLVMLGAVAEFGRYFETYTTLAKSTRAAARYLSNVPYDNDHKNAAKAMAVCGKTQCAAGEEILRGLDVGDITVTGDPETPKPETVTISVTGYTYDPIFDLGALLHTSFSLAVPVRPSTTMYHMWQEPTGAED
jgi:Flp pilus assembly protein TadG